MHRSTLRAYAALALSLAFLLQPVGAQAPKRVSQQTGETQEEINRRLQAELRADPLLRFQPLYDPHFVSADKASHIADADRVLGVIVNGIAKAYPTHYVAWHHVIQDDFNGTPVLVTWCALCGTGVAYKNDVNGKPGRFGMSGMVGTNVVLGDQETGTSWQQATGEAIDGPLKGRRLTMVTFIHTTWGEWRAEHPHALIMLPAPGREESYAHYKPMLATASQRFRGAIREDLRRPRFDQIAGLERGGAHKAYPLDELKKQTLVNDRVGSSPVLVTYSSKTGTVRAFLRDPGGRTLTFRAAGAELLTDTETGSTWNRTGLAVAGPLKDTHLETLPPMPSFWFAWAQFFPNTDVFAASSGSSVP